ncbi:protein argonaute-2 [Culicoides brevitarsis]|uniref:protein argonaute-2 n=1 Tax=Culicoides brevitarsis TaxID=469753 RepID=UPI00307B5564
MEKKQGKNNKKKGGPQHQGSQGGQNAGQQQQQQQQQQARPQTSGGNPQQQGGGRPPKGAWKQKKQEQGQQNPQQQGQQSTQGPNPQQQQHKQGPQGGQQGGDRPAKGDWKKNKPQGGHPGGFQGQQHHQPRQHPQSQPVQRSSSVASQQSNPPTSHRSDNKKPEDMLAKMERLSLVEANFPVRESVTKTSDKKFRKQVVATNYLTLNLQKLPNIVYHYDIKFDPDRPKKFLFPAFRILIATQLPALQHKVAYDGAASFYSLQKIADMDFPAISVPSPDAGGRPKDFKVSIKFATEVDMRVIKQYPNFGNGANMQTAIQVLDIILRTAHDRPGLIRHKRSVFAPASTPLKMKDNYELLIGLYQSFVMGERPYLNVDVSHKAFPSGADDLFPLMREYRNFADILRGLSLTYKSPMTGECKTYKFNAICGPADRETFTDDKNQRKTVAQYFQEKGVRLKNPGAPCLHIGPRQKNILIPLEFLSIPPGQAMNGKAPESCTRDMVRVAATSTNIRKSKIMDLLQNINYKGVETIRQFGLVVGEDFIDVNSHILNAPDLQYRDRVVKITKPGVWDGAQFLHPEACTKWAIFCVDNRVNDRKIDDFGNGIVSAASRMGMNLARYDKTLNEKSRGRLRTAEYDQYINKFKQNGIQLLFVIISGFAPEHYPETKKSAELRCGMLTQCIKTNTIDRMNASTLNNILLKVNAKLGGSNQIIAPPSQVSLNKRPFMVIGADVTHPSPDQQNIPSVVGVAASYDKHGFRYNCQWRIQSPRDETIRDLEEIVVQHLNVFKQAHNMFPLHIMYYRDGVSEGQFAEIKEIELSAIKKACQRVSDKEILVTVIVVQKRHHTRFFPKTVSKFDKNNNVLPGTVVDSEIVDSNKKWQFFMVSHASIQGVAKPTKYCVIHDEANITNEDLQVFTYNLCHLFTRCNRSVSYVAPTYYAHLVAARGRVYIYNERINFNDLQHENRSRTIRPEVIANKPMFFV